MTELASVPLLMRGAQYVRMSTEHQQYSTQNQADKILEYARSRGIEIVRTYADEGKSGLSIGGRNALQQLISDVQNKTADFKVILVYDVSRWGRFQDADESAYYEYICKKNGITVAYVAEQFENDGSPVSTIVKGVKRAMAGEYSRELSAKVFAGQCRLIELGFRQGGSAGYGLRRILLDQHGQYKTELRYGDHKSLVTDRVILVPGPADEVARVNEIFHWFIEDGMTFKSIAERLNDLGLRTDLERAWTVSIVRQMLKNEKYIGNNVYNRRSFKLKKKRVENPLNMWIRKEGAFEGIVPADVFIKAQEIIQERHNRFSDEELLNKLKEFYEHQGDVSTQLINQSKSLPSASTYRYRFGSMAKVYELLGLQHRADAEALAFNRRLRQLHPEIIQRTLQRIQHLGGRVERDPSTDLLYVNDELVICLVVARCRTALNGEHRWRICFDPTRYNPDITVAIRLDPTNACELDYYLLPQLDLPKQEIRMGQRNREQFECFRFEDLDFFYGMAQRERVLRPTALTNTSLTANKTFPNNL
jgi:DNA invertase Pin-like site-specific DNA recombinase